MEAELDRFGHSSAQTSELVEENLAIGKRIFREVVLQHQHFLADIPLDREVLRWDCLLDVGERCVQGPLVYVEIGLPRRAADVKKPLECGVGRDT